MSRIAASHLYQHDGHDEARFDWLSAAGHEAMEQVRICEGALALHYRIGGTRRGVGAQLRNEHRERMATARAIWDARDEFIKPGTIVTRDLWS